MFNKKNLPILLYKILFITGTILLFPTIYSFFIGLHNQDNSITLNTIVVEEYSEEIWDKIIGVILRGYFLMMI